MSVTYSGRVIILPYLFIVLFILPQSNTINTINTIKLTLSLGFWSYDNQEKNQNCCYDYYFLLHTIAHYRLPRTVCWRVETFRKKNEKSYIINNY